MLIKTEDIKEAAKLCKEGKEVAYVMSERNGYELFTFAYWQWRFKTLKTFNTIVYNKEKDGLFYFLEFISKLSFRFYKIEKV